MTFRRMLPSVAVLILLTRTSFVWASDEGWAEHVEAGRQAHDRGDYPEAERLLRLALVEVERRDRDDPNVASVLVPLAEVLVSRARYGEAEAMARRAVQIREEKLGRDHLDLADSLDALADVYHDQGRDAEAEPLYRRALAISEKSPDSSAEYVACYLTNLGNCLIRPGKVRGDRVALPTFARALGTSPRTGRLRDRSGVEQLGLPSITRGTGSPTPSVITAGRC